MLHEMPRVVSLGVLPRLNEIGQKGGAYSAYGGRGSIGARIGQKKKMTRRYAKHGIARA